LAIDERAADKPARGLPRRPAFAPDQPQRKQQQDGGHDRVEDPPRHRANHQCATNCSGQRREREDAAAPVRRWRAYAAVPEAALKKTAARLMAVNVRAESCG
jgi:hypothetical protein